MPRTERKAAPAAQPSAPTGPISDSLTDPLTKEEKLRKRAAEPIKGVGTLTPTDLAMVLGTENRHQELGMMRQYRGRDPWMPDANQEFWGDIGTRMGADRTDSGQAPVTAPVSEGAARAGLDFVGRMQAPMLARKYTEDLDRGNLTLGTSEDLKAQGYWEHQGANQQVNASDRSSIAENVDADKQRTLTWQFRDKGQPGEDMQNRMMNMELLSHEIGAAERRMIGGDTDQEMKMASVDGEGKLKDIASHRYTAMEDEQLRTRGWGFEDGAYKPQISADDVAARRASARDTLYEPGERDQVSDIDLDSKWGRTWAIGHEWKRRGRVREEESLATAKARSDATERRPFRSR